MPHRREAFERLLVRARLVLDPRPLLNREPQFVEQDLLEFLERRDVERPSREPVDLGLDAREFLPHLPAEPREERHVHANAVLFHLCEYADER
ncbi:MAG TPA: hypothetical protein VM529_14810, partial [Gemmata sp.]|nr:hypothetical protein [Gemmata sp.]